MSKKNKQNISFFRELIKSLIIGVIVFAVLYVFFWIGTINKHNFIYYFGFSMAYSTAGYLLNKYLAVYLNTVISWDKNPLKRLFHGVLWAFIITILMFLVLNYIQYAILAGYSIEDYINKMSFSQFRLPIYISTVLLLAFYSFYFYKELQELKLKEAKLQTENTKAKYNALKDQIDPHFLFNNLNVLYSIIDENPKNAKRFVKNLSMIYRYILEQKDADLISLESEIDFAKKYLELLKFRFEDSLTYSIDIKISDKKIVPLASQILLENAIKHNKITDDQPLFIKIYSQSNYLIIENNFNPKNVETESTKLGLKGISGRCKHVVNKEIVIENNFEKYLVKVPII